MTSKFDRPAGLEYNADLRTLSVAINQLIDAVEALQNPPKPVRKARVAKAKKEGLEGK